MQQYDPAVFRSNMKRNMKLVNLYNKRHRSRDGTPLVMSFLVTNRCILKCKHCFYHNTIEKNKAKDHGSEMTIDDYRKISNSLEWFLISMWCGGEPFLRKDLHEIVTIFRKNNEVPFCGTATNAQLTGEIVRQVELICQQDRKKQYTLNFSIDGFKEFHDEIRGEGTYDNAMDTWKEITKLSKHYDNLVMSLSTTINTINQSKTPDFLRWAVNDLKPAAIALLKVRQNPRAGEYLKDVDPEIYRKSKEVVAEATRDGKMQDPHVVNTHFMTTANDYVYETMLNGKRSFTCYGGKHGGFVDYNGDVNVCEIFPDENLTNESLKMGNLKDFDFDFLKLWNSERAMKIKQLVGNHEICSSCTHETEGMVPSLYFEPNEIKCFGPHPTSAKEKPN